MAGKGGADDDALGNGVGIVEGEADAVVEGFGLGLGEAVADVVGFGVGDGELLPVALGLGLGEPEGPGEGEGDPLPLADGLGVGAVDVEGAGVGPAASIGGGGRVTGRPFSPSGLLSSLIGMLGLTGFSSNGVPSTGAPELAEGFGTVSGTTVGPDTGDVVAPGLSGSTATVGGGGGTPSGVALGLGVAGLSHGKPATAFTLSQAPSASMATQPSRASLDPDPRMHPS